LWNQFIRKRWPHTWPTISHFIVHDSFNFAKFSSKCVKLILKIILIFRFIHISHEVVCELNDNNILCAECIQPTCNWNVIFYRFSLIYSSCYFIATLYLISPLQFPHQHILDGAMENEIYIYFRNAFHIDFEVFTSFHLVSYFIATLLQQSHYPQECAIKWTFQLHLILID
jgi:hypothetical protein